ncbi:unnamed protein product, partial [Polarella glacialis]
GRRGTTDVESALPGAPGATTQGQSKDKDGKWEVDVSYINHRTLEVDRLEGRKDKAAALGGEASISAPSASVKKEEDGKWKVDTSYIGYRTMDTENLTRKEEKSDNGSLYADPAGKKYSHEELRSSNTRPDDVDPARRELYLTDSDFQAMFGASPADFLKMPKWKQQNLKKAKDLF